MRHAKFCSISHEQAQSKPILLFSNILGSSAGKPSHSSAGETANNSPGRPSRHCPGKSDVVGGCAANYHEGVLSCSSQGKEIIWAEVNKTTWNGPCNYHPGAIDVNWSPGDGSVFTYDKTTITVAGYCRANFWICYKGKPFLISSYILTATCFLSFSPLKTECSLAVLVTFLDRRICNSLNENSSLFWQSETYISRCRLDAIY